MRKIILILMLVGSSLIAVEYSATEELKMGWTAFKTPAKKGVNGTFDKVALSTPKHASSIEALLVHSSVIIDTKSVNTTNPARDKKLFDFFFGLLNQNAISAEVLTAYQGGLLMNITLNGISNKVPMHFSYDNKLITAKGVIDLAKFDALKELASLNTACFDLHEGKTWSEVEIWFTLPIVKK